MKHFSIFTPVKIIFAVTALLLFSIPFVFAGIVTVQENITIHLEAPPMDLTLLAGSAVDSLTVNTNNFHITVPSGGTATVRSADRYPFINDQSLAFDCTTNPAYSELIISGGSAGLTVIVTPSTPGCNSGGNGGGSRPSNNDPPITNNSPADTDDTPVEDTEDESVTDEGDDETETGVDGDADEGVAGDDEKDSEDTVELLESYNDLSDHWASSYIGSVIKSGIMLGNNGQFRPNDNTLRCEMAAIALRVRGVEPGESPVNVFSDVPLDLWCLQHINKAAELGIISGDDLGGGKKIFRPTDKVLRPEALKFLLEAAEIPLVEAVTEDPFPDVPMGIWFDKYVLTAKEAGLIQGYQDGSFGSLRFVTRGEIATMASRIRTYTGKR